MHNHLQRSSVLHKCTKLFSCHQNSSLWMMSDISITVIEYVFLILCWCFYYILPLYFLTVEFSWTDVINNATCADPSADFCHYSVRLRRKGLPEEPAKENNKGQSLGASGSCSSQMTFSKACFSFKMQSSENLCFSVSLVKLNILTSFDWWYFENVLNHWVCD